MARKKRIRRGISAGTIAVLTLTLFAFTIGGYIHTRLLGDATQVLGDPSLLAEPLGVLIRSVADSGPSGLDATGSSAAQVPSPTVPPAAPTATPVPKPSDRSFTLTAVGQITAGTELRDAAKEPSGALSFSNMFAPVKASLPANLSVATLRTTLTDDAKLFETYRAPITLAENLKSQGITLLNLGTDRILDFGMSGVSTTKNIVRGVGISSAGAYANESERSAVSIGEFGGVKIGLLSYTGTISASGREAASDAEVGVATRLLTREGATADVRALREQGAEVVIVLAHWGNRSDTKPSQEVRDMADALVSAGADIILGTNPTQVHELERRSVPGEGGANRDVFIAYSLGNFLVDDSRETQNITGMVLHLDLTLLAEQKRLVVADAWYMPTWIMRWKDVSGVNRYQIVPAGASSIPDGMTDGVYVNMKKAYQSMVTRIGTDAARPKAE